MTKETRSKIEWLVEHEGYSNMACLLEPTPKESSSAAKVGTPRSLTQMYGELRPWKLAFWWTPEHPAKAFIRRRKQERRRRLLRRSV